MIVSGVHTVPQALRYQTFPLWDALSFEGSVSTVPLRPRVEEPSIR